MIDRRPLIFWMLLSLVLHLTALAGSPRPAVIVPPGPVYLTVELLSDSESPGEISPATTGFPESLPEPVSRSGPTRGNTTRPPDQPATAIPPSVAETPAPDPVDVEPEWAPDQGETAIGTDTADIPDSAEIPESSPVRDLEYDSTGSAETRTGSANRDAVGGGGPASGSPVMTPLAYGSNPPPPYPATARRRGWEGKVLLRVEVSARGDVLHVAVEQSSGYETLDEAARQGAFRWRFRPAMRDGHPIPGEVRIPVHFKLKKSD